MGRYRSDHEESRPIKEKKNTSNRTWFLLLLTELIETTKHLRLILDLTDLE